MNSIENKLTTLQLELPTVSTPLANYVPYTISGSLLFVSGQLPYEKGTVKVAGQLGAAVSEEEGIEAARHCMLNILAQAKAALGSLDKIKRCLKITGFVNATPEFTAHPKIINGASNLIVSVLGDAGKHARAAVGVSSLPLGAAVEIEAIFEVAN
ncbi:MAG: RidA family protein [Chthoniobacterales bacterium]|nr:RidA family protein [Chthoniobacterales bacterium]